MRRNELLGFHSLCSGRLAALATSAFPHRLRSPPRPPGWGSFGSSAAPLRNDSLPSSGEFASALSVFLRDNRKAK